MKFLSIFGCIFIFCFSVLSSEMNIDKGSMRVSGGFSLSKTEEGAYSYSASSSTNYFFWDKISFGGNLGYSNVGNGEARFFLIGPSLQYFFWEESQLASFFEIGVNYFNSIYGAGDSATKSDAMNYQITLGLDYFLNKSVSFGPRFNFTSELSGTRTSRAQDNLQLLFGFSIYLDNFKE